MKKAFLVYAWYAGASWLERHECMGNLQQALGKDVTKNLRGAAFFVREQALRGFPRKEYYYLPYILE